MKKIAVVYYSRTGTTKAMAELVVEGARSEKDIEVDIFKVEDFPLKEVLKYDGIIMGSPTYYGSMAQEIKKFIDDSVTYHGQLQGKVGGAFASSANVGGGNETTVLSILNAMLIHGMVVQGDSKGDHYGTVSIGNPDSRVEGQCRSLGKRIAALVKKVG